MDCYRHPGTDASATCVAGEQPICSECREEVAGHPMCRPCVAATQAHFSEQQPAATAPAVQIARALAASTPQAVYNSPGLGRRILRGLLWGALYGQWWTVWTLFSMFFWGHMSFDGSGLVVVVGFIAIVFGFFGSLTGLVIGAANAMPSTGMAIGIGAGVVLCLLEAAATHSAGMLMNLVFYFS